MRKLLLALALLFAAAAHAQYCSGYAREYTITIQAGAVTGTLANYTMLISGTYPYLAGTGSGGFSSNPNGYDITFNQIGKPLVWNMPVYNSGTGQIKANVLLPSATAGTLITMCVGMSGATAPTGNAYDSFTKMALQFPSSGVTLDSTGIQTLTTSSATHTSTGPAFLVDAVAFNGSQSLSIAGGGVGFPTGGLDRTSTVWINPVDVTSNPLFLGWGTYNVNQAWNVISYNGKFTVDYGQRFGHISPNPIALGSWHRWDIITNSSINQAILYLDGAPVMANSNFPLNTVHGVGSVGWGPGGGALNGQMAGVMVSNVARSGPWIATEYSNQTNPAAFYSIVLIPSPPRPVISGVAITANSPLSVKATWTTDVPSNSQTRCGTVSGGPYNFVSNIVNPNVNGWNVTAHSMASNPMPNGPKYCIVASASTDLFPALSTEVGPIVLPAMPVSVPIAMVNPVVTVKSKLGDRYAGTNGAPQTGAWDFQDNGNGCWAEDNNEYFFTAGWGLPGPDVPRLNGTWAALAMEYIRFTDAAHTNGARIATAWQNGVNNSGFNSFHPNWLGTSCISVNGNIYVWPFNFDSLNGGQYVATPIVKTTDHFQSTLAPQHNVGPDSTYITGMTCDNTPLAGTVHATGKLNITDIIPIVSAPAAVAILVAGAAGTAVNGVFGPVTATATAISWTNTGGTCAGWSWNATGGTGSGGGTINVYGWDLTSANTPGPPFNAITWIQNDGRGYENGTKWAGMDAFVYFYKATMFLFRMRIEDLPLQDPSKKQVYIGHQIGDDGIYDSNWAYALTGTQINYPATATAANGKGSWESQTQYLTDLHRFVMAEEIAGVTDSVSGGTAIYDVGLYPWSQPALIGSAQRNPDTYPRMGSGPEFPQFIAKSQTAANGVTSINLEHNGGNFGVDFGKPSTNAYDAYMNVDVQFVAKPSIAVVKPVLAQGEIGSGMDLAYNFDVPTGSLSMPNAAPSDARQRWAWMAPTNILPLYTDQYGSILHSLPSTSSSGGFFPSPLIQSTAPFTTPYAQGLPGPLTVMNCFGHYPAELLANPGLNAIALKKGTDLVITWSGAKLGTPILTGGAVTSIPIVDGGSGFTSPPSISVKGDFRGGVGATATGNLTGGVITSITVNTGGSGYNVAYISVAVTEPRNNWKVSFLGTAIGNISIADNSIGCAVVRRDSSNRVSLYTSAGIGKSLPLVASAIATVAGPWTNSPLVIGDAVNSFWGIESLLRVWSRDLADDELISEIAAIRGVLWSRGKGSAIP